MPDDLADIEQEFIDRLEEHRKRLSEDANYWYRMHEFKPTEERPIFPIGAW